MNVCQTHQAQQIPALVSELRPAPIGAQTLVFKRVFDLCLLAFLALPALLITGCFALATRLLYGGPGRYKQMRVGYRGRLIEVWKLRTMEQDADHILSRHLESNEEARQEWDQFFKLRNDPRILPYLGSFLRRSSLDELPQLLNILRGEMSFVGPRPLPPYHIFALDEGFRNLRQAVPPGLTGLWQISERSDGDLASHQLWDTRYIEKVSLLTDLWILARTPLVVLSGRGAR